MPQEENLENEQAVSGYVASTEGLGTDIPAYKGESVQKVAHVHIVGMQSEKSLP